jgi:hypothetical protein
MSSVQRAITEAIESVASTEARVSILIRALSRAGLARVPERGPEAARFLEGPLLDALAERLSQPTADAIVAQLRPLIRLAARPPSTLPPARRTDRPGAQSWEEPISEARPTLRILDPARFGVEVSTTSPEDSGVVSTTATTRRMEITKDTHLPPASVFILATLDDALVEAAQRLTGTLAEIRLRRVRGLFELVDASDESRAQPTTLVFDCSAPPVHVASLVALAADMPDALRVALLGASKLDLQVLHGSPERTTGWYYLERLEPDELGSRIVAAARALLSTGS